LNVFFDEQTIEMLSYVFCGWLTIFNRLWWWYVKAFEKYKIHTRTLGLRLNHKVGIRPFLWVLPFAV